MIRLLSPIGGKSNELNSSHNTLYFVDCPHSRGKVLCLLSIELLSGMGSRLHIEVKTSTCILISITHLLAKVDIRVSQLLLLITHNYTQSKSKTSFN